MKKLLKNGIIVTMNDKRDIFSRGYILIEDEKILRVGPEEEAETVLQKCCSTYDQQDLVVEDAGGAIIMPGMINTHCHLGMVPFRGLGDDCKDRLRVFLLPMESQAMDAELAECSARYAICELLLSGVTTVMDMYYFADRIAGVMDETGIRGFAGETVMEDATCDAACAADAIEYGKTWIEAYKNHARVRVCLSPHGTTTCSSEHLQKVHALNKEYHLPFTLHVAEMDYEMTQLRENYGRTPIGYLQDLGVLDEHTICAHSIQLTEEDIELLKNQNCSVAHCIGSNTKAAKGVAPVTRMREFGIPVGFGTDGPASGNTLDLFTQMRFCANFHKNETHDRSAFPAKEIVAMATIEGARALGIDQETGSLEPGKAADLVLVETDSVNMFPIYDPYSALVYSARADNVRDVYVAGRQLVKDKQLVALDLKEIRNALKQKLEQTAFRSMNGMI